MPDLVFSSKSLLENLGKENYQLVDETIENDENKVSDETSGNTDQFLLSSTLNSVPIVPKDAKVSETSEVIEKESEETGVVSDIASVELSDTDSISNGLIMTPNENIITPVKSKTLELLKILNTSNLLNSHDLLLASYYEEHKYDLITQKRLIMRVITWNLNQMKPPNLRELAGESGREWASFFYAGDETVSNENKEGLADLYSINFQETISLKSFSKSTNAIDEWVDFLLQVLNAISPEEYTVVYKTGLLALTTIIIAKCNISPNLSENRDGQIHNIRENTLGLGYLRWANKGCISVRFRVGGVGIDLFNHYKNQSISNTPKPRIDSGYKFNELDETVGKLPGVEIQILNVHLVHGENATQVQQRWDSWAKIERKIGLDDRSVSLAFDPSSIQSKDSAQVRLEQKLHASLNVKSNVDYSNYDSYFDQGMAHLSLNNDLPRTSEAPFVLTDIEKTKCEGKFTPIDINKFKYVTEANKAIVVCGDTNYRFSLPTSSQSSVQQLIAYNSWNDLLQHDQLKQEMRNKKVFIGFSEPEINFAPTFKIINNSNGKWVKIDTSKSQNNENKNTNNEELFYLPRYDTKRLPAYTDRILHVEKPYFENVKDSYSSITTKGSDHLPVASSYFIDAPIVDEDKLHLLRSKFNKAWDEIINKLVFLDIYEIIEVNHSMKSRAINDTPTAPVTQNINMRGGSLKLSCIVGETLNLTCQIENITDEAFNFIVREQTNRGWFGTKILVNCKSKRYYQERTGSEMQLQSKSKGEIVFSLTPTSVGVLERTFSIEIPDYKVCPAYIRYIALSIRVEDIFGTSFESINEKQFENILSCFKFIMENSSNFLLATIEDTVNTDNLTSIGWDLVREVSLWEFDKAKYEKLNISGENLLRTNIGSINVMAFLFLWLKSQSSAFNTTTKRGKVIFSNVLNLIKYLKLDVSSAYDVFGWLFTDEYELHSYFDKDFDIKLEL